MKYNNCKELGIVGLIGGLSALFFTAVYTKWSFVVGLIGLSVCLGMMFGSLLLYFFIQRKSH